MFIIRFWIHKTNTSKNELELSPSIKFGIQPMFRVRKSWQRNDAVRVPTIIYSFCRLNMAVSLFCFLCELHWFINQFIQLHWLTEMKNELIEIIFEFRTFSLNHVNNQIIYVDMVYYRPMAHAQESSLARLSSCRNTCAVSRGRQLSGGCGGMSLLWSSWEHRDWRFRTSTKWLWATFAFSVEGGLSSLYKETCIINPWLLFLNLFTMLIRFGNYPLT